MPAIELHDLTLGYDRHPAVHHLEGLVASGELVAVVGPNGAGKSTLLKGMAGVLKPLGGSIRLDRARRIAYLPQSADIDKSFPLSVYDLVAMGLWESAGLFRRVSSKGRVEAALAAVGLTGFEQRAIGTLSGGQMQRALFARLLLQDAGLILLDEPFTAIDTKTTTDLLALVQRWHGENRTVVAVLHDIETVRKAFPRTILLARESVAWGPTADVLTPANLLKARQMIEAFDNHAAACNRHAA